MGLISLLWLLATVAFGPSSGDGKTSDETVDAIRVAESMPHLVLVAANEDSPMLECLTADRVELNASARTFAYEWRFKGQEGKPQQDIPLEVYIFKDHPDTGVAFANYDHSKPVPSQAVYSDYKSCFILKVSFDSQKLCLQWVSNGSENAVPETCNAAMNEKCGDVVLLYKDDTCK